MATRKPLKTRAGKGTVRTSVPAKRSMKAKSTKTSRKTVAPGKGTKNSGRTTKTRKAMIKRPATISKKKELKTTPAAEKKSVARTAGTKPQKKLTPRERKIQEIRKILVKQRNALLSEAEEALNALPGQTIFPDMGDQASAEIDRSFMLRLRGREQRLLKKIDQAIEKIENGTFGVCDVCGEEITIQRLEARPVTNMCIFCKTEQEEEEKLRGK